MFTWTSPLWGKHRMFCGLFKCMVLINALCIFDWSIVPNVVVFAINAKITHQVQGTDDLYECV